VSTLYSVFEENCGYFLFTHVLYIFVLGMYGVSMNTLLRINVTTNRFTYIAMCKHFYGFLN